MIPFRTTAPGANVPVVTMMLIVANVAVFLYHIGLNPRAEIAVRLYLRAGAGDLHQSRDRPPCGARPATTYWPLLTNTFMHGGWLHLIFNMWTLWLFGIAVEGRMARWRYLVFYLLCGLAGSVGHRAVQLLNSTVPALGASGRHRRAARRIRPAVSRAPRSP